MQLPNSRYMVQQCIGDLSTSLSSLCGASTVIFQASANKAPKCLLLFTSLKRRSSTASEITVPLSLSKIWPSKWNWFAEDKSYWVKFVNSQIYFMHFKFDFSCSKLENCPFLCVKRGLGMFLFHILHQICNSVQTNKSLRK